MLRSRLRVLGAAVAVTAAVSTVTSVAAVTGAAGATPHAVTYSLVTEPGDGYTPIYNLINSARTSIDLTMYELTDTAAEQDLVAAAGRGVTVRVILDQNLEKSHNTAAYNDLSANGVQVRWAWSTYAATHEKSIVVDGATAAIMTGRRSLRPNRSAEAWTFETSRSTRGRNAISSSAMRLRRIVVSVSAAPTM